MAAAKPKTDEPITDVPSDAILNETARYRVVGASWDWIARKLRKPIRTFAAWIEGTDRRWSTALRKAAKQRVEEILAESVSVLQQQMRGDEPQGKMRHDAAAKLIRFAQTALKLNAPVRRKDAKQPMTDSERVARAVDRIPLAELSHLTARFRGTPLPPSP